MGYKPTIDRFRLPWTILDVDCEASKSVESYKANCHQVLYITQSATETLLVRYAYIYMVYIYVLRLSPGAL